jgi:hypothetical protein
MAEPAAEGDSLLDELLGSLRRSAKRALFPTGKRSNGQIEPATASAVRRRNRCGANWPIRRWN